jgi:hypothetical protein
VIKFVSDLRQVGGFLLVLGFPLPIKTDRHDITEILLKVALNTINQTNKHQLYGGGKLYWSGKLENVFYSTDVFVSYILNVIIDSRL